MYNVITYYTIRVHAAPAVSESISVYVINTRCGEFFLRCDLNNFFHIILYTHAHTRLSRSSYIAFTVHTHTYLCLSSCVYACLRLYVCV